jgi:hypothetical protein
MKAKTKTVAYDQLKMWVDKEKVSPTKIECLTEAGMLIKTLYFKDIKDFGEGIERPATVETDSPLYKGYKSLMLFANFKKRDSRTRFYPDVHAEHGVLRSEILLSCSSCPSDNAAAAEVIQSVRGREKGVSSGYVEFGIPVRPRRRRLSTN